MMRSNAGASLAEISHGSSRKSSPLWSYLETSYLKTGITHLDPFEADWHRGCSSEDWITAEMLFGLDLAPSQLKQVQRSLCERSGDARNRQFNHDQVNRPSGTMIPTAASRPEVKVE